jgi:hypothetical protein
MILKPQNLHDSETQSAIDPINPVVYIQARDQALKSSSVLKIIHRIIHRRNER